MLIMRIIITLLTLLIVQVSFAQEFEVSQFPGIKISAPEGCSADSDTSIIILPIAKVGHYYSEVIKIKISPTYFKYDVSYSIESVNVTISGLPSGMERTCDDDGCEFFPDEWQEIGLSGTPNESGKFVMSPVVYATIPTLSNQLNIPAPKFELLVSLSGCMVSGDCNYNPAATDPDDSCVGVPSGCQSCNGTTGFLDNDNDGDGTCNDEDVCPENSTKSVDIGHCGCDVNEEDCVRDCAGNWGGVLVDDECGVCDGDNSSCWDCNDVPNGLNLKDECGTCDTDSSNDCVKDCNGHWGGSSVLDDCSVCGGDDSSCTDACGVPNGDNSSCADACGVPNGDDSSCSDCAQVPNGPNLEDECGNCDSDSSNDCVEDCMGVPGGTATELDYYLDFDGDGLGSRKVQAQEFCNGIDFSSWVPTWVPNNDDEDDSCFFNIYDCFGKCDGNGWESDCGCVAGDNSGDDCDDCAGTPNGDALVDNCDVCDADASNDCVQDCAGTWGGVLVHDECGVCGGDNSSCADCAGISNGDALFDNCGTCDNDSTNDCVQDCAGTPNGDAVLDNCGTCDTDSSNDCTEDCSRDWGGSLVLDDCGVCGGDDSSCADACGVPNGDNSSCADACGVPNGDNSSCSDCAQVPNGPNSKDECGNCDSDSSNDCVEDCMGVPGGTAIVLDYYLDIDGDGFGAGSSHALCDAYASRGFVLNNDDEDDFCFSNIHDCFGKCDGNGWESDCGCVAGDNSGDDCDDCAGTPNGDALVDNCDVCDADSSNDCVQDCAGKFGGVLVHDECGVCGGDNSSCADCAGISNGDALFDNCGTCDNDSANDCVRDCNGHWGGSLVDDACGVCDGDDSSCSDCAQVPNGPNLEDECGNCDSDSSNDCVHEVVEGCMTENDCNYNPEATDLDGSCAGVPTACDSCDEDAVVIDGALDGICDACVDGVVVDHDADDDGICDADEIGIVELEDLGIKLYPNPAKEKLYLVVDNSCDLLNVQLMNIMGAVLSERELRNIQSNDLVEFNIKLLSTGLYLLKVSTNTQLTTIRWMKQ